MMKKILKSIADSHLHWHVLGIVTFILFEVRTFKVSKMSTTVINASVLYAFNISFFYISSYVLIPATKKKISSIFFRLICYATYVSTYAYVLFLPIYLLYRINHGIFRQWISIDEYSTLLYRSAMFFVFAVVLEYFLSEIRKKQSQLEYEKLVAEAKRKNLEMENRLLRSQLNPHFISNGLSFIHTESIKISKEMARWVASFSDVMKYHLSTNNNGLVTLDDDLDYLENYISSQLGISRGERKLYFIRDIDEDSGATQIYPLLFMSFVENIFKHGALQNGSKSAVVIIRRENQSLIFHCENDIAASSPKVAGSGIGIANTERRLKLLYPDRHNLSTKMDNSRFITDLKIELWNN